MTPPARSLSPGNAPPVDPQKCLPTPFLSKTYSLVDDHSIDKIISWNEEGLGFIVWNPTKFARDLLPKYFKHNNFSSFVRQLNTYGFRKVVPDRWEFSNESFRKGEKRLLCDIQRHKVTPPGMAAAAITVAVSPPPATPGVTPVLVPALSPSNSGEKPGISSTSMSLANPTAYQDHSSSSGCSMELVEDNERLRKENTQLTLELSEMKIMCDNIYNLMSNYASNQPKNGSVRPLDLLMGLNYESGNGNSNSSPMTDGESRTRIFGISVGAKRMRKSDGKTEQHDQDLQLRLGGMDEKSEPSDTENNSDDQECMWLGGCVNGRSRNL